VKLVIVIWGIVCLLSYVVEEKNSVVFWVNFPETVFIVIEIAVGFYDFDCSFL